MNLLRQSVLQRKTSVKVEAQAPVTVKQQAKAIKVRMPVPAAVFVPVSKAVRFRFPEDFPKEVLITYSLKNMLL